MNETLTHIVEIIAGVLTGTFMLPQLIKVIKEKKVDEISILMLAVLITGITLWIIYGVIRNDMPLIVSNTFSLCVNLVLMYYGINKSYFVLRYFIR